MADDIRNILLPLNSGDGNEAALSVGAWMAHKCKAHLSAILVGDDPNETAALAGEGLTGAMINEMIDAAEHDSQRRLLQARLAFDRFLEANDIQYRRLEDVRAPTDEAITASLELLAGPQLEAVTWFARLADITLLPHLNTADDPRASETLHAVLFDSGRPVMIAPQEPPPHVGKRLCIAWNGTVESTVALRAALPWANTAEKVTVLSSPDYQRRGPDAQKAVKYLEMHGIEATHHRFTTTDRDVGAAILNACRDAEADMLVMGAYSHSRLRQMILGGVTRHILEHAPLTVLMCR